MLFAFIAYKEQFAARVSGLIDKLVAEDAAPAGRALADIVLTRRSPRALARTPRADPGDSGIELRDVSFRYAPREPEVLSRREPAHRAR
jgi:ATP-binding cassette subfamily B protein RaxB